MELPINPMEDISTIKFPDQAKKKRKLGKTLKNSTNNLYMSIDDQSPKDEN